MVFITINALHVSGGSPPIIRSSKLYTQHQVFVEIFLLLTAIMSEFQLTHNSSKKQKKLDQYLMLCIQFWAPDDEGRNCLKHVEHLYNKYHCVTLHLVGFAWKLKICPTLMWRTGSTCRSGAGLWKGSGPYRLRRWLFT